MMYRTATVSPIYFLHVSLQSQCQDGTSTVVATSHLISTAHSRFFFLSGNFLYEIFRMKQATFYLFQATSDLFLSSGQLQEVERRPRHSWLRDCCQPLLHCGAVLPPDCFPQPHPRSHFHQGLLQELLDQPSPRHHYRRCCAGIRQWCVPSHRHVHLPARTSWQAYPGWCSLLVPLEEVWQRLEDHPPPLVRQVSFSTDCHVNSIMFCMRHESPQCAMTHDINRSCGKRAWSVGCHVPASNSGAGQGC
jgi:hypothetical protein